MADTGQDKRKATFKFIEKVHNCPAVWDVSSVVYKDTKTKQRKMEELADKLSFIQTFLAFCFFSTLLLFHCSTWVPLHQVGHVANYRVLWFDASFTCEGTSLPTFWSLPTRVCQLKFAVWRPLKRSVKASMISRAAQALSLNHTSNTIWHQIIRVYKNGLPYSIRVLLAPGVVILPIELDLSDFF